MTRFPTEHRTLISTSMENRYRMLRLVMRATLDVFVGFLLKEGRWLCEGFVINMSYHLPRVEHEF